MKKLLSLLGLVLSVKASASCLTAPTPFLVASGGADTMSAAIVVSNALPTYAYFDGTFSGSATTTNASGAYMPGGNPYPGSVSGSYGQTTIGFAPGESHVYGVLDGGGPTYGFNAVSVAFSYEMASTYAGEGSCPNSFTITSPGRYMIIIGGVVPPCNTNLNWTLQNGNTLPQTYVAADYPVLSTAQSAAGVPEPGGNVSSLLTLNPGQAGTLTVETSCTDAPNWKVYIVQGFETVNMGGTNFDTYPLGDPLQNAPSPTGSSPGTIAKTTPTTTPPQLDNQQSQYNTTNSAVSGTNSPIIFSSTNTVISQQQGDQALYTAVVNGFDQEHKDLSVVQGELSTNSGSGMSSNQFAVIMNGAGSSTNLADLNATATNGLAGTSAEATTQMGSDMAGVNSTLSSMASAAGSVYDGGSLGSGGTLDAIIPAGGAYQFEINPSSSTFSPLFALAHQIWSYILVISYMIRIIKDISDAVWNTMKDRGEGLPALQLEALGTGGNLAGASLFPAIVTILMLAYAAFLGYVLSSLTGVLSWSTMTTAVTGNPLAGMDNNALGLLVSAFPVALLFGLVSAYIIWRLTVIKVVVTTFAVLKFLPRS